MSNSVIIEVVQQMENLPANLQQQVLGFVKELTASERREVPGRKLLRFAGTIHPDDLELMSQAIEQDSNRLI